MIDDSQRQKGVAVRALPSGGDELGSFSPVLAAWRPDVESALSGMVAFGHAPGM